MIDTFINWWNRLAKKNGKLKFRNQREAADFVRSVVNSNGKPNAKLMEMRRQYEAVRDAQAKGTNTCAGSHDRQAEAV